MRCANWLGWVALSALGGMALPALAFEARTGTFVADSFCVATVRIRDSAGVSLEPGASYRLLGANRPDATHFQIRLPDAGGDRWVPVACGHTQSADSGTGDAREYVLAVSWQPAFCEGHADKPECTSQSEGRFDATHFTLHGLWPQPRSAEYCGVAGGTRALDHPDSWPLLPAVELTAATRAELDEAMPGTQSALERHEWIKHGTCFGAPQEEYFRDALHLLRQLNESAVRAVVSGRIGGEVSASQLAQAFDASFGLGAGERMTLACDRDGGRELIVELRLNLKGAITEETGLSDLLRAAPAASPECRIGLVDPAGPSD